MAQHSTLHLNRWKIIPTTDIIYLKSDINYTDVHTLDNRKQTSGLTLKVLANRITDTNFLRINRGLLINLQYIKAINAVQSDAFVLMTNGKILPVSLRKYKLLMERANNYSIRRVREGL